MTRFKPIQSLSRCDDFMYGEAGTDNLYSGAGDDYLDGGDGTTDRVRYTNDSSGVTVSLASGTATDGYGDTDTLVSIEWVYGSNHGDSLTGDAQSNRFYGAGGADTLYGGDGNDYLYGDAGDDFVYGEAGTDNLYSGAGDDYFDGGAGTADWVRYTNDTAGVTVSLASGTATDGYGDTDTLVGIERIQGSAYSDSLSGDAQNNYLYGNNGADTLYGGDSTDYLYGEAGDDFVYGEAGNDNLYSGAGDDYFDGGAGTADWVRYTSDPSGVTVNLATGMATDGYGDTDTLTGIERIQGSAYNDSLTGDAQNNYLYGNNGDDTLYGGDGTDYLYGQGGSDTFVLKSATAFNNVDRVQDFTAGAGGDAIDITDVLDLVYDPQTQAITDFVSLTQNGSNTFLAVDRDGTGGTYSAQNVAQITGVTGLSVQDLITDGNLLVPV